jgi:hypothetical protein
LYAADAWLVCTGQPRICCNVPAVAVPAEAAVNHPSSTSSVPVVPSLEIPNSVMHG